MKRPLVLCAVISAIICVIGVYYMDFIVAVGAIVLIFFFFFIFKRNLINCMIIAVIFCSVLSVFITDNNISKTNNLSGHTVIGKFKVIEVKRYSNYCTLELEPMGETGKRISGKILAFDFDNSVKTADIIKTGCTIKSIDDSEYKLYDYSNGIYSTGTITDDIEIVGQDKFLLLCENIRKYVSKTLLSNISYDETATLNAITTGEKHKLTEEFQNNIRNSGVSHVMVVSGMHLAVIMSAIFFFIEQCINNRFLKFGVAFISVILLTGICGFTMSVLRAGVTYIFMSFSLIIKRDNDSLNTLAGAVCMIVIWSPFAILNISFQLTVLATMGIIVVTPFFCNIIFKYFRIRNKILKNLITIGIGSVASMILTMPIIIYSFGFLSIIAPITNILISFPSTLLLVFTFLGLIISAIPFISPLSNFLLLVSGILAKYMNAVINIFGSLSFSAVRVPKWAAIPAVILVLLILVFICIFNKSKVVIMPEAQTKSNIKVSEKNANNLRRNVKKRFRKRKIILRLRYIRRRFLPKKILGN